LVPAVPIKLLLVDVDDVGPKEGIGDLARDEDATLPLSLSTRSEGALLTVVVFTAVEGRDGAIEGPFFRAGIWGGRAILLTAVLGIAESTVAVGAVAGVFPRFQTFCTSDLADDKNPNFEGFGFGLTARKIG
jgi:hypothetical protein